MTDEKGSVALPLEERHQSFEPRKQSMKMVHVRTQKHLTRGAETTLPNGRRVFIPVLQQGYSRSKYMPHQGEKQRAKSLRRALKNKQVDIYLEAE